MDMCIDQFELVTHQLTQNPLMSVEEAHRNAWIDQMLINNVPSNEIQRRTESAEKSKELPMAK